MPRWLPDALRWGQAVSGRRVPAVPLPGPTAVVLRDTVSAALRELTVCITAPSGAPSVALRVAGRDVRRAVVDSRLIETSRFRRSSDDWAFTFSAPPDGGFTVPFALAPGPGRVRTREHDCRPAVHSGCADSCADAWHEHRPD